MGIKVDLTGLSIGDANLIYAWVIDHEFVDPCNKLRQYRNENGCYSAFEALFKFELTPEEATMFLIMWPVPIVDTDDNLA